MRKKSKQYWFNVLIYELSKAEPIDGESKNLDEHLADWLKRSHDMLNAASQNGAIEELAYRYADGETDLTKTNEYARTQIREALGEALIASFSGRFYRLRTKNNQKKLLNDAEKLVDQGNEE